MRFFNTLGPMDAELHYQIPPLARLDINRLLTLIRQQRYFVLHAPHQTGKTSALLALRGELKKRGEYQCVYINVEVGQSARQDVNAVMHTILHSIASEADDDSLDQAWRKAMVTAGPYFALQQTLTLWSRAEPKPIVLMIDDIDALIGDALLAVLHQLRAGYVGRPHSFPQSIILCGVQDVSHYHVHSVHDGTKALGGGLSSISSKSLRLGNLSEREVESLLRQHTEATGQAFTKAAHRAIWSLTKGQPWLVNALAQHACFESKAGQGRQRPIVAQAIQEACEQLICRRDAHLDQLADELQEARVRRVIKPLLTNTVTHEPITNEDIQYVRDLGLVTEQGPLAIANPIYLELISRDLASDNCALIA